MVKVGDPSPSWSGVASNGARLSDATFRGRPLLLYFYPKAGTSGCTLETRQFAVHTPEFEKAGVAIVGVSVDPVEKQQRFAADCAASFPLVADTDKSIARSFGVLGLLGMARRVTFWVGPDGRVEEIFEGMMPGPHIEKALARLSRTPASSPPAKSG